MDKNLHKDLLSAIEVLTQAEYDAKEAQKILTVSNWLSALFIGAILLWAIVHFWR